MSNNDKKIERILLIMNPKSGTMQAARYLKDIIQLYSDAGYLTTVLMTQKSGDARDFAIRFSAEADIVVVSGGDGTLNEVIDGVITCGSDTKIGYIPSGSTNDFASSVGLPKGIMDAAQVVLSGTPTTFDIGSFNGRYFSYVASFGAFTSTSYSVPQNLKNIMGHTAYVLQGIRDIVNIKKISAKIITDEGTIIRTAVADIPILSRNTQGVRIMRVAEECKVVCVARADAEEEEAQEGEAMTVHETEAVDDMDFTPETEPQGAETGEPDALDRLLTDLSENPDEE